MRFYRWLFCLIESRIVPNVSKFCTNLIGDIRMSKPTAILQTVGFLDLLAAGLVVPQLSNQAIKLGCSHILIGTMGSLYAASQLIAGPIIGNYSDLKGRKPTLLFMIITCAVAYMLLGITSSVFLFFTLRLFLGFFKQTQLVTKSLAPDYISEPAMQSVVFGRLATLSGMGMSIGPMLSGHIVDAHPESGFTIITVVIGGIFAVNAYLISCLPNVKQGNQNKKNGKRRKEVRISSSILNTIKNGLKESISELRKVDWAIYWDVFLTKMIMGMSIGMYFSNYALFLKTKHAVLPKYLGYIIAFQGGIASLCTFYIGHFNKLYKNDIDFTQRSFHIFVVVTMSFIAMGLAPNIYFYILFVMPLAISTAVGRVAGLEMAMNRGRSDQRGSVIGAMGSVRSLAAIITPILAGVISEYIGINYVIFFAASFSAIGIVVSYKIRLLSIAAAKTKKE